MKILLAALLTRTFLLPFCSIETCKGQSNGPDTWSMRDDSSDNFDATERDRFHLSLSPHSKWLCYSQVTRATSSLWHQLIDPKQYVGRT